MTDAREIVRSNVRSLFSRSIDPFIEELSVHELIFDRSIHARSVEPGIRFPKSDDEARSRPSGLSIR